MERYTVLEEIGKGSYGSVYKIKKNYKQNHKILNNNLPNNKKY